MHALIKTATAAGLVGLVILHPDAFAKVAGRVVGVFRNAVRIA